MKFNKNSIVSPLKYAVLLALAIIITFTGLRIIPGAVSYSTEEKNVTTQIKHIKADTVRNYTLKSVGEKICVMLDGEVLYELSVTTKDISEHDKLCLKDGITITDENEMIALREYLES